MFLLSIARMPLETSPSFSVIPMVEQWSLSCGSQRPSPRFPSRWDHSLSLNTSFWLLLVKTCGEHWTVFLFSDCYLSIKSTFTTMVFCTPPFFVFKKKSMIFFFFMLQKTLICDLHLPKLLVLFFWDHFPGASLFSPSIQDRFSEAVFSRKFKQRVCVNWM